VLTHLKQMQLEPCIVLPSSCWDRKLVNTLETNATQALHRFPRLCWEGKRVNALETNATQFLHCLLSLCWDRKRAKTLETNATQTCIVIPSSCWDRKRVNLLENKCDPASHGTAVPSRAERQNNHARKVHKWHLKGNAM